MKNLSKYDVQVSNDTERQIALTFFQRASHRPLHPRSESFYSFVGMYHYDGRYVYCGCLTPGNTSVPFKNISILADTQSRREALAYAFKKHGVPTKDNGSVPVIQVKETTKTIPSKLLPVVNFNYPLRDNPRSYTGRVIRVVKMDTDNLLGYDLQDKDKFKRFKLHRILDQRVKLVRFND